MLVGRSLFGGGALFLAATVGIPWVIAALVACIWITLVCVLFVRRAAGNQRASEHRLADFRQHLQAALRQRTTWLGLAFALVAAAGFEATGQLAGPFLVDRGTLGKGDRPVFRPGGGRSDARRRFDWRPNYPTAWGRIRAVAIFLVGFVVMIAGLAFSDLAMVTPQPAVLMGWLTGMYFFIGLFTASSYALFMDLTDARLGGTQFSAFMSATNGCESWSAWAGGRIVGSGNYDLAFLVMAAASLVSLPLLKWLAKEQRRRGH